MGTIKKQRNTEACLQSQATDFVTILMTCPGYTASKRALEAPRVFCMSS